MEAESSSRDLLNRFAGMATISDHPQPATSSELSLGLSLGGCFNSNPREKTNFLIRSSSLSSFPNHLYSNINTTAPAPAPAIACTSSNIKEEININIHVVPTTVASSDVSQLKRTCSMPVPGADEEYKKRKVLQTLKRLEAKRKRHEKKMSMSSNVKGEEGSSPGSRGGARMLPPLSQVSLGSAGSTSGSSGGGAAGSMQGLDDTIKKIERRSSGINELDMPCVSTRGNGPNGKKIEGFLYNYKKGEEVRIVCVCHGNFLTPAEFVRHAGGGDVNNPMRHIVVNKPSSPLV